jgi:hypothetical protein
LTEFDLSLGGMRRFLDPESDLSRRGSNLFLLDKFAAFKASVADMGFISKGIICFPLPKEREKRKLKDALQKMNEK